MPNYTKENLLLLSVQDLLNIILAQQNIINNNIEPLCREESSTESTPLCGSTDSIIHPIIPISNCLRKKHIKGNIYFPNVNLTLKEMIEKSYKKLIVRILKNYEEDFRKIFSIDKEISFIYDKKQETTCDGINIDDIPDFSSSDQDKYSSNPKVAFYFKNEEDYNKFIEMFKNKYYIKAKTLWYPHEPIKNENIYSNSSMFTSNCKQTLFPIYIPSYKRYETLYTVKALENLGISNYKVIIRPTENEEKNYIEHMTKLGINNIEDKLLVMREEDIQEEIKNGNNNSIIPRKIAWNDAIKLGYSSHWCIDDNIKGFSRRIKGNKIKFTKTAYPLRFVEEMMKRYPNVMQGALQYEHLCPAAGNRSLVILNSRSYSCILNRHFTEKQNKEIGGNWRGSYNEDTDLSLRILKAGYPTMTFQNILCNKQATSSVKGGNNVIAYTKDGFLKKAEELYNNHKDVCKIIKKYNRIHHQVDYSSFKKIRLEENIGYKLDLPELLLYEDVNKNYK